MKTTKRRGWLQYWFPEHHPYSVYQCNESEIFNAILLNFAVSILLITVASVQAVEMLDRTKTTNTNFILYYYIFIYRVWNDIAWLMYRVEKQKHDENTRHKTSIVYAPQQCSFLVCLRHLHAQIRRRRRHAPRIHTTQSTESHISVYSTVSAYIYIYCIFNLFVVIFNVSLHRVDRRTTTSSQQHRPINFLLFIPDECIIIILLELNMKFTLLALHIVYRWAKKKNNSICFI